MENGKKKIVSFQDLDVYQRSISAASKAQLLINFLREKHEYEEADQLSRSTKAIPALIAEGYVKRYLPKHFQKYLTDGIGEANESISHLTITENLGFPDKTVALCLKEEYTIIGKQLYRLGESWQRAKSVPII